MEQHPEIAMLSPSSTKPNGEKEYLCKNYPKSFDLLLRGFAPGGMKRFFSEKLNRYEMRGTTENEVVMDIPLASGCFMFFRRAALVRTGGFSEDYFMYFEDFDLSLRIGKIAYVPTVRITHFGGGASRKGWRHVRMFAASAFKFYRRNGLCRR